MLRGTTGISSVDHIKFLKVTEQRSFTKTFLNTPNSPATLQSKSFLTSEIFPHRLSIQDCPGKEPQRSLEAILI